MTKHLHSSHTQAALLSLFLTPLSTGGFLSLKCEGAAADRQQTQPLRRALIALSLASRPALHLMAGQTGGMEAEEAPTTLDCEVSGRNMPLTAYCFLRRCLSSSYLITDASASLEQMLSLD